MWPFLNCRLGVGRPTLSRKVHDDAFLGASRRPGRPSARTAQDRADDPRANETRREWAGADESFAQTSSKVVVGGTD